jgi:hypothetical protein
MLSSMEKEVKKDEPRPEAFGGSLGKLEFGKAWCRWFGRREGVNLGPELRDGLIVVDC